MEDSYGNPFSKAVLTAVFAGIGTTLICLVYNIFFREATGFSLSDLINVSSLIFSVNLIFLLFGLIYYFFLHTFKKGNLWYMLLFVLATLFTAVGSLRVHRTNDLLINLEFRHLLAAFVIIVGIVATFGIPYLFNNKRFQDSVI